MGGRRYNCGCGKKRYRDEASALAAAEQDLETYGGSVTVYRCPGGLAWHLSAHGFVPEALRSVGRRLAYELITHDEVDLAGLRERRGRRVDEVALRLVELGLARSTAAGHLVAVDRAGLTRVVQVGLDAYEA